MTPNKEDYIKAIYELGGQDNVVSNKKLVHALSVSAASVTEMNARLLKENLITYTPYQGVKLTEDGLKIANKLIRKHRLWEVFLAEKLGYNWNEVHADADLLEHVSSEFLIDRLDHFLNEPQFDPHGGMIPNKDGSIEEMNYLPLVEMNEGTRFIIKEVDDQKDFLKYLLDKQIKLGNEYLLKDIEPYEGPLTLVSEAEGETIISFKAAFKILVKEVK